MASQLDPSVVSLFADAVRTVYQRWTALNLAVTNEWGDGDNLAKRESLIEQTVSGFVTKRNAPDPSELEEFLDQYLQEMFNTEADDDSPYEVSHLICRLFELVRTGSIDEARALLSAPAASLDQCVADKQGEDSSDEGSDCEMMEEEGESSAAPETVELTAEQQADIDDGWGVVVRTSKGRTKQVVGGNS